MAPGRTSHCTQGRLPLSSPSLPHSPLVTSASKFDFGGPPLRAFNGVQYRRLSLLGRITKRSQGLRFALNTARPRPCEEMKCCARLNLILGIKRYYLPHPSFLSLILLPPFFDVFFKFHNLCPLLHYCSFVFSLFSPFFAVSFFFIFPLLSFFCLQLTYSTCSNFTSDLF